jgi:hypothetical protein
MTDDTSHEREAQIREGGERGEGRPLGVTDSGRPHAEGRPSDVRHADPATKAQPGKAPTEDAVEHGETPDTEHQPGGDL